MAAMATTDVAMETTSESEGDLEDKPSFSSGGRFSDHQTAKLISFFESGMRGVGKQYTLDIEEAAADTGLTIDQVKVSNIFALTFLASTS